MSDIFRPQIIKFFREGIQLQHSRLVPILSYSKIKVKSLDFPLDRPVNVDEMQRLVWKMIRTCVEDDGIGLAASQIGVFRSLFVFSRILPDFTTQFIPCFNPSFEAISEDGKGIDSEGCLSVPGQRMPINRWNTIKAKWYDLNSAGSLIPHEEILSGFEARVFQHEWDHCFGISIVERHAQQNKSK